MQIVIDIPEDEYNIIKKFNAPMTWAEHLIAAGTPLPKGHGKLIDADELKEHKYHDNHRYENAVAVAYIDWADAIIEADNGESEG